MIRSAIANEASEELTQSKDPQRYIDQSFGPGINQGLLSAVIYRFSVLQDNDSLFVIAAPSR